MPGRETEDAGRSPEQVQSRHPRMPAKSLEALKV